MIEDGQLRGGASLIATALHLRLEARLEGDPEVSDVTQQVGRQLGGGVGANPALRNERHQGARGRAAVGADGHGRRHRRGESADHGLSPPGQNPLLVASAGDGHGAVGNPGRIGAQRRSDPKRAKDGGDPEP